MPKDEQRPKRPLALTQAMVDHVHRPVEKAPAQTKLTPLTDAEVHDLAA